MTTRTTFSISLENLENILVFLADSVAMCEQRAGVV